MIFWGWYLLVWKYFQEVPEKTPQPESAEDPPAGPSSQVYINDDLTQRQAWLAYLAINLKHDKLISDTWTMDCKILIENLYGRVRQP